MGLDTKQKVLIAIYTEYQKDIPDFKNNIKADILGLPVEVFRIAVAKLENEGMICDVNILKGGSTKLWNIQMVMIDNVKMTSYGIDYIENKLGIDKTLSGLEKVKYISGKGVEWGWEQFKDIAAKTLSEIISNQV